MEKGHVAGDETATVLLRALHIVSAFLECRIFVRHVARCSTTASSMADALTRVETAGDARDYVAHSGVRDPPESLWQWLRDPRPDWRLGFRLVNALR